MASSESSISNLSNLLNLLMVYAIMLKSGVCPSGLPWIIFLVKMTGRHGQQRMC